MSYNYNPRVTQKLSYAGFLIEQLERVEADSSTSGLIPKGAYDEAVVFELVNGLRAFLAEIADNYGLGDGFDDAQLLSAELQSRGIVSPEVEEIAFSISGDGWIAELISEHEKNCAGKRPVSSSGAGVQTLRFHGAPQLIPSTDETGSRFWFSQLSNLIDRHREGLVEW